jgi:hypothetical protein
MKSVTLRYLADRTWNLKLHDPTAVCFIHSQFNILYEHLLYRGDALRTARDNECKKDFPMDGPLKLTVGHLVKKLSDFYGNRKFITM